jgi:phenylacetate-CoA ligase
MIHPKEVIDAYQLMKNQWKSPEEIKRIQDIKLRKLVKHAYEKVPYYRQLFDTNGLKPGDVQTIGDLKKLPLLSKETVKNLPLEQIVAKGVDVDKCRTAKTSGTTSMPLQVYFTWRDARMIGIALVRSFLACGVKPWHKTAEFSAYPGFPKRRKIFDRLTIWRNWKISTWEELENWIKILRKWKPQVLYGYVMTLRLLAETILEDSIKGINPEIIISTTGVLDKASRTTIRSAFKAKVFDFYGSWEGGNIAWECPQCSGYHINSDMLIFEVLKEGKQVPPGQEGEVVITNLYSYAMPFIRYRQGDIVVMSDKLPSCGRPFPLIKEIKGRIVDFIILPSGKKLSPHPFHMLMVTIPGVTQFRISQKQLNLLIIEIVPSEDFNQSNLITMEREFRKLVGDNMRITISLIKKIDFPHLAKRRIVDSKIIDSKNKEAH